MAKTKTALYARVSTSGKDQDTETQLIPLREYARSKGLETLEYVDEGISGAKSSRPGLNRMLRDIKHGKVNAVVVTKLDRLGRNLRNLLELVEGFNAQGVQFVVLDQGIDTKTATGKLLLSVLGSVAEFERALIAERVRAGMARIKAEGKVWHHRKVNSEWDALKPLVLVGQISQSEAARRLSVHPSTVSRLVRQSQ